MTTTKRFLALLLVLCTLFSFATPVFASEVEETAEVTEVVAEEAPIAEPVEAPVEAAPIEEPAADPAAVAPAPPVSDTNANESGLWYNLNWAINGSTLTITGSGDMYEVNYKNYPWYQYRGQISTIVVGDYVTRISSDAFAYMSNLTDVSIGSRVASIGNEAFYECGNLLSVTIPASVTSIEYSAFIRCTNLVEVNFAPNSKLQSLGNSVFESCKNLISVDLPNSLVSIGEYTFAYCNNLLSVTFGNKLKSIGYSAFRECTALIDAYFPASLRTIADYAFYNCNKLVAIELQYGLESIGYRAFHSCTSLSGNVKIPGTVTSLKADIFHSCSSLESAQIYAACAIPNYAFKGCTNLSSVTIGGTVTGINEYAFYGDTSLTKVNIPGSVAYVGYSSFRDCTNLATVTFASGLTKIDQYGFYNSGITSVKLPNSVTELGYRVFGECDNLTTASVGNSITYLPTDCFINCPKLSSVKLNDNINSIGNYAFNNAHALTSIDLPANLNSIGRDAFNSCTSLTTVVFPSSLNTIGYAAFYECSALETVILERNVTSVENYAFAYCPSLTTFKTFSTNSSYGGSTFYNTPNVTIHGWADSTSHEYAASHNIAFVPITNLDAPTSKKIVNTVSGVHVYWNAVPGASYYTVYRATSADGDYSVIKSVCASTHYTDTTTTTGKTYYYKIVARNGAATSDMSAAQGIAFVGTPDITSRINNASGIKLGWDKITGATGYAIYRKSYSGNDAWVRVATINGNSTLTWTDTSVKNNNGEVYKYTIRALSGSTLSGCRNTGRTMVRLSSQVLSSAAKASSTSVKCAWTTSSRVTGYEVRFVIDGQVYKTFTVGNWKTGVKTFTGLKAGQTYTVQVRTYKKVDGVGSFYSDWSTAKTVKT